MYIKKLSKILAAILLALCTVVVVACSCNGESENSQTRKTVGRSDPFAFKSNVLTSEVKIDGVMDDDLWKDENRVEVDFATSHVTIIRRSDAIYLFYKTKDITPYALVGVGDDDEVTHSDSIEFYVDSKLGRSDEPVGNCYQINLGRDGRTRIMSGYDGAFYKWIALYSFEVKEGDTAADYDYYNVEVMLPIDQMNMGENECIGVAFGQVDRQTDSNVDLEKNYVWAGYEYKKNGETILVDPQVPATYLVLSPTSLVKGRSNRLYTYSEYLSLTAGE